ncbi:MAG: LutB/LldF family L-lactate oxidation iron-sulfur protein [Opitutaceae bacterium]|jgi:L-lactate dehydrogenase complex protein LldF
MKFQPIDQFAAKLSAEKRAAVYDGTKSGHERRTQVLFSQFENPNALRQLAGEIKQHTLENLDTYLEQAEASLQANGAQVHWAADAGEACRQVLEIMHARKATRIVKAKTMVSEEIELAPFLEKEGIECLETDLGEFIVQIDHDHPSHIVKPIIHKNRREIATSFEKNGLGAYNDDPATITMRARKFLRPKYLAADVGITGANFVSAESGRLAIVTNEGNSRFCLAAPKVHIALVGIEKLVPRDRDLALFLNLLARSGTGQPLTVYTEFISGPRAANQPDGPEEMHVIFVDNGRSRVLASECRAILRCIRCGACLNVCPVYRQTSGHAYRSVYPGPVGAVLSPLLAGDKFPELADLPKASSLCGACNEVCPVNIPIPDLLLRLRDRAKREGSKVVSAAVPPLGAWSILASQPLAWKASLALGGLAEKVPTVLMPAAAKTWIDSHGLPAWRGGRFREWMKGRRS